MDNSHPYIPINCSFYDQLEEAATLRQIVMIEYYEKGERFQIESKIKTLFLKEKAEFMQLENGQSIRLDDLIKFNGKHLSKSC